MKFQFLTKTYKNRQFDYSPLHYDERKERLEAKKKLYDKIESGELTNEARKSIFRDSIRGEWSRSETRKRATASSNLRIILLIGLILALGYFVFFGVDQVDTIVTNLWD